MRPKQSVAAICLLASWGAHAVWGGGAESPSSFAADGLQAELARHGPVRKATDHPRTSSDLRAVVIRFLDRRLLGKTKGMAGRDFRFESTDGMTRLHLGVIVLRYSGPGVAKRMSTALIPMKGYFRNSKILTRFAAVQVQDLLVIAFSETSGDERVESYLRGMADRFQKATDGGVVWREPGIAGE